MRAWEPEMRARLGSLPLNVGQGHGSFSAHRAGAGLSGTKALELLQASE